MTSAKGRCCEKDSVPYNSPFFFKAYDLFMAQGTSLSYFTDKMTALGASPKHIHRVYRAWLGLGSWEAKSDCRYPAALEKEIPAIRRELEGLSRVLPVQSAQAETVKLIVGLADGECVESVLLPRRALCISTQVGCAVGCRFCMTGRGGLTRQLGSAEIVAQVVQARKIRPDLKKVVFMGMGEPSHNLREVMEAVNFLGRTLGLAHKEIVVSTVGDKRLFDALRQSDVRPAIALSLHTTDNAKRRKLLTNAPKLTAEEVLEMTLSYAEETKYPAQIEWTLIRGVNDSEAEAARLAELLKGRYAMVNFIAVNPVEGTGFERPERSHMEDLITILRKNGTVATIRDSAAQDIEGGCGQLRSRIISMKEAVCSADR